MTWSPEQGNGSSRRPGRSLVLAAMIALGGTVAAGCSDDDDGGDASQATTDATEGPATDGSEASAEEQLAIDIVDIGQAFEPSSASITVGGEVTWVNAHDLPHTATAEDGTWDSGNLGPGEEFTFTADEPGTYTYVCSIHPSMQGELIVE
ncbi:MAG: cupredoxin domain-containing protein [Acidimicrobiales bacterium]